MAGILSISSRFLPTIMNLLRRLAEEAQGHPASEAPRTHSLDSQSFKNENWPNPISSMIPESSVSSNVSASDDGIEYSSPHLTRRRSEKVPEGKFSG